MAQLPPGFVLDDEPDYGLPAGFVLDAEPQAAPVTGAAAAATQPFAGFNRGVDNAVQMVSGAGRLVTDRLFEGVNALAGRELFDTSAPSFRPIEATQEAVSGQTYEDLPVNNAYDRYAQRVGEEIGASVPALAGVGAAAQGTRAINAAPKGLFGSALQEFARRPGAYVAGDAAASVASGMGAQGARDAFPGNPVAEMAGQLFAPAAGLAGAALVRGGMRGLGSEAQRAAGQAVDDAARAGTSPTAAQLNVGEGRVPFAGVVQNSLGKTPGGASSVSRRLAQQEDEIGQRVAQLSRGAGRAAPTPEDAGRSIRQGIEDYRNAFQRQASELYEDVDAVIPPQTPAPMTNARRVAQEVLGEGVSGQLGDAINDRGSRAIAQSLLADEPRTYADLSRTRSQIGQMLNDRDLIGTRSEAALKRIYGALTDDVADVASAQGPEATQALNRANEFYRDGATRLSDQLQPLLRGDRADVPEQLFRAVERGGKDGATRIRELRMAMSEDQWDDVSRATLDRIGRATPGQQDAEGAAFSAETFLTNWNRVFSDEAKDVFFGRGGQQFRDDIDAIARTLSRRRDAARILANPSGTAAASANIAGLTGVGGAALAGRPDLAGLGLAGIVTSYGAGDLITRPWFARWAAQAIDVPSERAPSMLARLSATAQMAGTPEDQARVQALIEQYGQGQGAEYQRNQ